MNRAELEQIIADAVAVAVTNSRPKIQWPLVVGWILTILIPTAGGVFSVKTVMDQVAAQQIQISDLQQSKMNKDVVIEHWKQVDWQITQLIENSKRIEAEIKAK